jgi:3'-phosphoadenosine 5'-phosphosulfate sulfotransferase (PAPS reductase)/FAD synthetase
VTPLAVPETVAGLLAAGAPVAMGVSGGKDSSALTLALTEELDRRGHAGPRILIHSDLGRVEWKDSLPTCERLAERLGLELVVVRRAAGGLMERWLTRWANNVGRYARLECVRLILPWSTASMRFCTSELKTAVICRELIRRFPGQTILSATGIRADESTARAKQPVVKEQPRLTSVWHRTSGYDWHPLHHWTLADVWAIHERTGFPHHEAYRVFGSSRVSCAFCILASAADLEASARCVENEDIYRELVDLEITSTFAFREGSWLGDVAPHLLTAAGCDALDEAKVRAARRERAEARIPAHLLYDGAGWPRVLPTWSEAVMLAKVRQEVADAVGLAIDYQTPESILVRYEELMRQRPGRVAPVTVQEAMAL